MKQFEFDYNGIVKIYVPSTMDESKAAPELQKEWTNNAISFLSDLCGGCTVVSGFGAWKNDAGEVIREAVNIVYSFCNSDDFDVLRAVVAFAEDLCKGMKQTAVTVEFCGRAGFVSVE